MKNETDWKASKFLCFEDRLIANPDSNHVAVSSRLNVELLARALAPLLKTHVHGDLLDLGCGAVPLYACYKTRAASITCVDWPSSAHGSSHIDTPCDLNEPLPMPSRQFDTVIMTDVLEHLRKPGNCLQEVGRILRPGGKLIGSIPFMYWLHEEPHDHGRYTEHGLRALFQEAGLRTLHLAPYGAGPDVVFDLLGKLLVGWHWRWGPKIAAGIQRIGLWMASNGQHSLKWRKMPLGYTFVLE